MRPVLSFSLVLAGLVLVAACDDSGGSSDPTPSAAPTMTTTPTVTAAPTPAPVPPTPEPATEPPATDAATAITAANAANLELVEAFDDVVWLDFTPDGRWIALQGSSLALRDRTSGEVTELVEEVPGQNYATAISADGRHVFYVTEDDEGLSVARVRDVGTGEDVFEGARSDVGAVFLPDTSRIIVAGSRLYGGDLETGEPVELDIARRSTPTVIDLLPDGTTLVTSSNGFILLDDVESGEERAAWDFTIDVDGVTTAPAITGFSVTPDGEVAAVGVMFSSRPESTAVHLVDVETGEARLVIPIALAADEDLRGVAISPDGSLVVAAVQEPGLGSGRLEAYDAATGEPITTIQTDGRTVRIAFSPDGTILAVGHTRRDGLDLYGVTG